MQEGKPLNLRTNPLIRRVFGLEGELALMISIILFVALNALMLYTDTIQSMASKAMNYDLIIDLDYRQSHAQQFANLVSQLPGMQTVACIRCSHEQYVLRASSAWPMS